MMNKKVAPFFFIGFFIVAYLGVTTTGVAIFSICLVLIMVMFGIIGPKPGAVIEEESTGGDFDEF